LEQPFFAVFNPTMTHESGQWEEKGGEPDTDPDSVTLPPYLPDTPKARKALARQYDNIARSDALLGERLKELEEDGLADNTIVVVWSDHGEGLPRGKRWLYDGGIRVPLIVRWPGQVPAGEVSDRLVSGIDLPSTMLSVAGVPIPPHMQGKAFLGEQEQPAREFIHAARDRFDESYDMVRAVRDSRFKYIRNFRPDLPYLLWIPYRNRHPVMQEMWRLYAEDKLTETQKVFMANSRPAEELYDTENDPFELNNLASNPNHRQTLARLRAEMERWRQDVGDWGEMPEMEMVREWHGHGEEQKTQTAQPIIVPLGPDYDGTEPIYDEATLKSPVVLQFHTPTQGAAFSWTLKDGPNATNVPWAEHDEEGKRVHWNLYTGPIRLEPGTHTLRVRASRYGFEESPEQRVTITIQ
jgi:hypothetical protein